MPHQTLKIVPGVDENRTLALNEAALSYSNLIRFVPDRQGLGLPQKLGGWTRFFPNSISATPRSMHAWSDTNKNNYLAIGCQTSALVGNSAPLYIINNNNLNTITPQTTQENTAVSVTTTTSSNVVLITDAASNITSYDSVFVATHISVGGVIIYGLYQCASASANTYNISITNAIGEPVYPTSNVTNGGSVATFTTTVGNSVVKVTLANHGFSVGDTFPVLVSTSVGGVTFYGEYIITEIVSSSEFNIQGSAIATSAATVSINGGNAQYDYFYGYGSLPVGSGYGTGGYGAGGYGSGVTPVAAVGTPITATDWSLDNWGAVLIACPNGVGLSPDTSSPKAGPVYYWNPQINQRVAQIIPQAPVSNAGVFVAMPQRQIIAWGSTFNGIQDPLLVRWCEVDDFTIWAGTATNQAGSYRISKGSKIIGAIQGPQQGLLWTDLALWAMQYVGQPYIYQFNEIGTGCGLIAPKAAISLNGIVYWMGQSQFFSLAGEGVKPVFCPIWDVIFQDLDTSNLDKIRVAANSRFGEVSWFYPTKGNGGENNAYVKYNVGLNQWDYGSLDRTAWINQSIFGPPIAGSSAGVIYQHETSTDADGLPMPSSFQTGYFTLSDGDVLTYVDQFWPDAKWGYFNNVQAANLQITFYVANYPGDTPQVYGPYTVTHATQYITPRFRGRLVSLKIESNDVGSFWRLGAMRYRYSPDGKF